jgi:hypothetical protein
MDQWKAKGEAVGENTTCVQTQTAGVGGLSPISLSGEYSGKRSTRAGSSGSNFAGFGSPPVYVHLVCVDRSPFFCNAKRMYQWKAKGEAVGENTTCVQTQTAAINLSQDETTQTDQHNSDAQAINIPTVSTKKWERSTQTRCT